MTTTPEPTTQGRKGQVLVPVHRDMPIGEAWDYACTEAAKRGSVTRASVSDSVFVRCIDFTFDIVTEETR
ncbi:hypothetical protein SEA_SPOOKY_51 [Gordonia phage Spooky]|nr:hypothetical protein SEA_SPOOKY_51 [Gordonia phage Spooky]